MPAAFVAICAAVVAAFIYVTGSMGTPAAAPALPAGAQLRGPSVSRSAFVSELSAAISNVDMRQIPRDLALVLFDLETGTGRGDIFIHTNNPGSVKSTAGWTGKPAYKETRIYRTLEEGITDWVRLISEAKGPAPERADYRKAYAAAVRRDFKAFFLELEAAGYEVAIDPPYSARLASRQAEMHNQGWV